MLVRRYATERSETADMDQTRGVEDAIPPLVTGGVSEPHTIRLNLELVLDPSLIASQQGSTTHDIFICQHHG